MTDLKFTTAIDIQAAAAGKPPRVSILAYSGDVMSVSGYGPVALDLTGLQLPSSVNLLADHLADLAGIVGNGIPTIAAGRLTVDGTLAPSSEAAGRIVALSKEGVQFQASVGVKVDRSEYIDAGKAVQVNGKAIKADRPFTLVKAGILCEVSIVAIGADASTSVSIAAKGTNDMADEPTTPDVSTLVDIAAGHPEILKAAVAEKWTEDKTRLAVTEAKLKQAELELVRAGRPRAPAIHDGTKTPGDVDAVLECAMLKHTGQHGVAAKAFKPETLEAADRLAITHSMDWVKSGLRLKGIEATGQNDMIKAAFSTVGLSGILSNVANKSMLDAYRAAPSVAKTIARKLSAKDFKDHTGYRLTGDFVAKEVGAGGELKHATIDEASFTYSVDTYGRMFGVTRKNLINDDLGAFTEIPRMIGRGCALALEQAFWTLVLANTSSFFAAGNSNAITDALDSTGLAAGVQAIRQLVDADGNPLAIEPKYLVVPPELEAAAEELFVSRNLNATGNTDAESPDANIYFRRYQPLVSPYLSNTSYTGYSTTAWYLFGDPADVACFGIAYLNGSEVPVIEDAPLAGDVLGQAWRGYLDFGVCQVDHHGGVKSTGVA